MTPGCMAYSDSFERLWECQKWISSKSPSGCQLAPASAITSCLPAHWEPAAWTLATPDWAESARAVAKSCSRRPSASLQERVDHWHWPLLLVCRMWRPSLLGAWHPPLGPSGSIPLTKMAFPVLYSLEAQGRQIHPEITAEPMLPAGHRDEPKI